MYYYIVHADVFTTNINSLKHSHLVNSCMAFVSQVYFRERLIGVTLRGYVLSTVT